SKKTLKLNHQWSSVVTVHKIMSASHLSKILILRPHNTAPLDTENNTFVRNHLVSTLHALKWHVEKDLFTDMTPYGEKRFMNVIATKDPDAPRRLVLAAHFDSKYFPSVPQNQVHHFTPD
ncbi:hypothetical protein BU17DRAFT_57079, partial [Hysterangium stoloniferum]